MCIASLLNVCKCALKACWIYVNVCYNLVECMWMCAISLSNVYECALQACRMYASVCYKLVDVCKCVSQACWIYVNMCCKHVEYVNVLLNMWMCVASLFNVCKCVLQACWIQVNVCCKLIECLLHCKDVEWIFSLVACIKGTWCWRNRSCDPHLQPLQCQSSDDSSYDQEITNYGGRTGAVKEITKEETEHDLCMAPQEEDNE